MPAKEINLQDLSKGVLKQDRIMLARAITLIESNAPDHFDKAQKLLTAILPNTGNSIRIGITGVPGAGKSTLIEVLGMQLIKQGHRVAVLAIDPSSSKSGGSILGDKTRMEKLSLNDNAFIRPSPAAGALGGVARKTRETILLCEAAGYDIIIIETMGVGQGEIIVRSMVDFFLLVQIAGAGDELQGIKRGIMEMADAIAINKADGENKQNAIAAKRELRLAVHYLGHDTPNWDIPVLTCSALSGEGIDDIWKTVKSFLEEVGVEYVAEQRKAQNKQWLHSLLNEHLTQLVFKNPDFSNKLKDFESKVLVGEISTTAAAFELLKDVKKIINR